VSERYGAGFEQGFSPWLLASGCGALWCADDEYPVVVRVDPATRDAEIWAAFPSGEDADAGVDPPMSRGPLAIAVGLGAV
jgi:hypothetical protein